MQGLWRGIRAGYLTNSSPWLEAPHRFPVPQAARRAGKMCSADGQGRGLAAVSARSQDHATKQQKGTGSSGR